MQLQEQEFVFLGGLFEIVCQGCFFFSYGGSGLHFGVALGDGLLPGMGLGVALSQCFSFSSRFGIALR